MPPCGMRSSARSAIISQTLNCALGIHLQLQRLYRHCELPQNPVGPEGLVQEGLVQGVKCFSHCTLSYMRRSLFALLT